MWKKVNKMSEQQSKEERVHCVFENISEKYDTMNSIISFKRHKAWRKDTLRRMDIKHGTKALDVCCGTGDFAIALAEKIGLNGHIIGLDFSENMLKVAEQKVKQMDLPQLEFVHGNAMELPFAENSFDYVTIGFGLRNVPDYMTVLKEMYRVLKPGGIIACLETSQPTAFGFRHLFNFYFRFIMPLFGKIFARSYEEYAWLNESTENFPNKKELKKMFIEAGFSDIQIKSYSGGVAAMHLGFKRE